ncbi:MAG TPA: Ldh family oxidoreductase [Candidatus Lokiarchaeia archaeon]|nr:Ldh family oxidoreductase [Candidatus Lokiarchaeia archaeon]
MTDEQMWYLPVETVYNLIKDSFMAMGVSEDDAKIVADILIESDLRGIESHGVGRLYYYYVRIRDGQHLVTNPYYIVKETKTTALIDANNGEGHVVAYNAMKMAIAKAKEYGLGAVAVRNSTHFGIAGYYTNMAANEGLIGLTTTNARPSIPPTWSVEPMLGTNPLSWAMPTDEPFPFSLDCATSIVQRGKIEWYDRAGKPVPENLVIGNDGESLTDAAFILKGLTEDTAALLPVGGAGEATGGYKGYGYATVVEILSAALSTAKFLKGLSGVAEDGSKTFFGLGHFFLAIDPEAFCGLDEFKKTTGDIMRSLRAAKLAPGAERIYTAGEKEYYNKLKVQEEGVPINEGLAKELLAVKKALNLTSYEFPFDFLDE